MFHMQKKFGFLISSILIAACAQSSAGDAGPQALLPDSVLGKYTGTFMYGQSASQFTHATIAKVNDTYRISFSGGKPAVDGAAPAIDSLRFKSGPQNQTYESIDLNGSKRGVHLSTYMTNMNIESLSIGGQNLVFTGVKCEVTPQIPVCTCERDPTSSICQ